MVKVRNESREYLLMYDDIDDIIDTTLELIELERQSPRLYKKALTGRGLLIFYKTFAIAPAAETYSGFPCTTDSLW